MFKVKLIAFDKSIFDFFIRPINKKAIILYRVANLYRYGLLLWHVLPNLVKNKLEISDPSVPSIAQAKYTILALDLGQKQE